MAIDVGTLCLGLLSLEDATGYEIKKAVEDGPTQHFLEASFGAIYPALARLDKEGLVECRLESQSGKPDRKIYSITEAGRTHLAEALVSDPAPDRFRSDFMFMMLFSDHLDPGRASALIDAKIADYEARIAQIDEEHDPSKPPGMRFVASHGRAVYEAAVNHLKTQRHLLETTNEKAGRRAEQRAGA